MLSWRLVKDEESSNLDEFIGAFGNCRYLNYFQFFVKPFSQVQVLSWRWTAVHCPSVNEQPFHRLLPAYNVHFLMFK